MGSFIQKDVFLANEGDAWFKRNEKVISSPEDKNDPVIKTLQAFNLKKNTILEIGCSNGWRLEYIRNIHNSQCYGIEPSSAAIEAGAKNFPELKLSVGSADMLPYDNNKFDVIIFGFCLYLCDRADLFKIAAEADRVLKDGGIIVIYDFSTPVAYKNKYSHFNGLYSYKMDYTKIFTWNPAYSLIQHSLKNHAGSESDSIDNRIAVSILKKDNLNAYPDSPF